jgi:hypothetical protein
LATDGLVRWPHVDRLAAVDAFPLIVLGGIGIVVLALVLVARFYPGSGADLLDWRPTRSYEAELELESEDVQQMIDAQNEYRRRRGEPEITESDVRDSMVRDHHGDARE